MPSRRLSRRLALSLSLARKVPFALSLSLSLSQCIRNATRRARRVDDAACATLTSFIFTYALLFGFACGRSHSVELPTDLDAGGSPIARGAYALENAETFGKIHAKNWSRAFAKHHPCVREQAFVFTQQTDRFRLLYRSVAKCICGDTEKSKKARAAHRHRRAIEVSPARGTTPRSSESSEAWSSSCQRSLPCSLNSRQD